MGELDTARHAKRPGAPADGALGRAASARVALGCVAVALGSLLVPVLLTRMPPLLDYPNHVARLWLLLGGAGQAPLDTMYRVDWSGVTTNIGADLLAAALGGLVSVWTLAPILLGAAVLLPPLGAVLLNRAVFGGWHWWQAGFAVLAWNGTLMFGFLNFQVGLGLALLAAAADVALRRRAGPWGVVPARAALAAALTVVHPFAAVFQGVLLASLAFGPERVGPRVMGAATLRRLGQAAAAGLCAVIPMLCLALLAPTLPGGTVPAGVYSPWSGYNLLDKVHTLCSAFLTYDIRFDALFILALWIAALRAVNGARLRVHSGLVLGALGLALLGVLVPSELGGTANVDWRFPVMAALAGAAALQPGVRSARWGQAMAAALMLVSTARTAWVGGIWHERQADVAALQEVLAFVPAGAAVLPMMHARPDPDARGSMLTMGITYAWHLHTLAVPLRQAFVPTLFAAPGKQPLRVLPPWSEVATPEGRPVVAHELSNPPRSARGAYNAGYVAHWRSRFQYALVLNALAPGGDERGVPGLELVADRGFARLYRIVGGGVPGPGHVP